MAHLVAFQRLQRADHHDGLLRATQRSQTLIDEALPIPRTRTEDTVIALYQFLQQMGLPILGGEWELEELFESCLD